MSDRPKGARHSFKKGVSGNPKGRPKVGLSLRERVRALAGADGNLYLMELHALAVEPHDNPMVRLSAIKILLERGWGQPIQEHEHSGSVAIATTVIHEYHKA